MNRRLRVLSMLGAAAVTVCLLGARPAAAKPKIVAVGTEGPFVSWTQSSAPPRIDAILGYWNGGIGDEPAGWSLLKLDLDVYWEGGIRFNYQVRSTGDVNDWLEVLVRTATGDFIVLPRYNPHWDGTTVVGPVVPFSVDLTPWIGQTVQLRIGVHQNGDGYQTQAVITNLRHYGDD